MLLRRTFCALLPVTGLTLMTHIASAQDCEPLKPTKPAETEVANETTAQANILYTSIGSAGFENNYKSVAKSILDKSPNADKLFFWQGSLYLVCTILSQSTLFDDAQKLDRFAQLLDRWMQPPPGEKEQSLGELLKSELGGVFPLVNLYSPRALEYLPPEQYETFLIRAVQNGHLLLAKTLLGKGTNPNVIQGESGLMWAVDSNHLAMVDLLLDHGANPNDKLPGSGYTALMRAADGPTPILSTLIKHGAALNDRHEELGYTPLHFAASSGTKQNVKELLENGADPSIKDNSGRKAVDIAKEKGKNDIADFIEDM